MTFTFNQLIIAFTVGLLCGGIIAAIIFNIAYPKSQEKPDKFQSGETNYIPDVSVTTITNVVVRNRRPLSPLQVHTKERFFPEIPPAKDRLNPVIDIDKRLKNLPKIDPEMPSQSKQPEFIIDPITKKILRIKR